MKVGLSWEESIPSHRKGSRMKENGVFFVGFGGGREEILRLSFWSDGVVDIAGLESLRWLKCNAGPYEKCCRDSIFVS